MNYLARFGTDIAVHGLAFLSYVALQSKVIKFNRSIFQSFQNIYSKTNLFVEQEYQYNLACFHLN